jgi:hypothetical protein
MIDVHCCAISASYMELDEQNQTSGTRVHSTNMLNKMQSPYNSFNRQNQCHLKNILAQSFQRCELFGFSMH